MRKDFYTEMEIRLQKGVSLNNDGLDIIFI